MCIGMYLLVCTYMVFKKQKSKKGVWRLSLEIADNCVENAVIAISGGNETHTHSCLYVCICSCVCIYHIWVYVSDISMAKRMHEIFAKL